jgi:hypothetical protein
MTTGKEVFTDSVNFVDISPPELLHITKVQGIFNL